MWLNKWTEMKVWPTLWDLDFGFAPIGAHMVEPSIGDEGVWCFNDKRMDGDSWSQAELRLIYNAQIAAALARLHRIPHLTVQIRGVNVWLHSDRSFLGGNPPSQFNASLFSDSSLLLTNLADTARFVIHAEWIEPVAFRDDNAPNLQMLLTKFDIN